MQLQKTIFTGLVLLILSDLSEGCPPHGQRRRKRSTGETIPSAPPLKERLAKFFGSCPALVDSSTGIFKSLQSAVDYVIRDTNWYNNITTTVCAAPNDNVQCWIYALNFLIDEKSELYQPTAQCMCEWSEKCYDPSQSSHHVAKRRAPNEIYDFRPPNPKPTPEQGKPLPKCLEVQARRYIFRYPSLRRVEGSSIITFLKKHYTYCRLVPDFPYEQRNLFQLLYSERLCPRTGAAAAWRNDFSTLFAEATRMDGPIWTSYQTCQNPCYPNPCQHGGACVNVRENSYTCRCPSGYTGKHCETLVDPCVPNPCKNKGKCKSGIFNSFNCFCSPGYTGNFCEKKDCINENEYLCSLYDDDSCRYGYIQTLCKRRCNSC